MIQDDIRNALIVALPEDTPTSVIDEATRSVLQHLHAPFWPARETIVKNQDGGYIRATPNGTVIGTAKSGVSLRAGHDENGWTPVLVHGWMGTGLLR